MDRSLEQPASPGLRILQQPISTAPLIRAGESGLAVGASVADASPLKVGQILDEEDGSFGFEYDNTCGQKNAMRLEAFTYEGAVREARSYLGIQDDDRDADGKQWTVE